MYQSSEFRKGIRVDIDGTPFIMIDTQFVKPGKGQAFTRCKLRNLLNGNVLERTLKIVESLKKADVSDETMQFLYKQGADYIFMNTKTYDQLEMDESQLGDAKNYIIENMEVQVQIWSGKPISVEVPNFVELDIVHQQRGLDF